ncbi:hypothetical protein SLEP1_g13879 [Rubroshorea leprosula]|uniref:Uncharacterized protein n=1 Tax=Rubroshorea leprosula TaxID=152421 RepID=A0AAV5IN85_9ROSI|nr:hypothetical protein SLEP1_g13879 [Rubroshorea leprosula]
MDGDKKDQLPSTESTSTTAKIKAIQPKKLPPCRSDQVFVPYMKSQILGPYFVSPSPIPFKLVYPQLTDHPLPFQVKPNWSKWVGQVGPWPTWRKSKLILSSALLFWTGSFNCFHFPCGIMSVSLFNISSLIGLPRTAEEISALLTMPLGIEYDHKDLKPSFVAFVRSACDRNPVEEKSDESGEDDSGSYHSKFGDQSSPATKVRGSRFSLCMVNKNFKASFIADITEIDDDLENELLAKLDMLTDLPVKLEYALDSKRKFVAEETNSDVNLPSQEQIRFAILTLQELIDDDPSHFCKVPDQQAAFQAAQVLSRAPQLSSAQHKFWAAFTIIYAYFSKRFLAFENKAMIVESARKFVAYSTTAVFKKKDEFLAAKDAHTAQIKHLQGLREEISNLEAKLVELRKQVPLAEQAEKSLAEQRKKLRADIDVGLKSVSEIKDQLPSVTASADEAAEELKNMREEWSNWRSNFC